MTKTQITKLRQLPKLLKAIHQRCLDCSAYSVYELKNCVMPDCPLFSYGESKIKNNSTKIPHKKHQTIEKNAILGANKEKGSDFEKLLEVQND